MLSGSEWFPAILTVMQTFVTGFSIIIIGYSMWFYDTLDAWKNFPCMQSFVPAQS
jgi:hypothetical protein